MQRVRSGQRESLARLRVVLQALQFGLRKTQRLAGKKRCLPCLVVYKLLPVDGESDCDLAIQKVGLGKAEHNIPLQSPHIGLDAQGLPQSEEVVGRVAESNERS